MTDYAGESELRKRIAKMEDRLTRFEMDRERKDKELKEKFETLRVGLENEALAREIMQERKMQEIKLVESGVTLDLNLERQGRLEAELRLNKSLDEMVIALSVELQMQAYSLGASGAAKDGAARGGAAEGGAARGGAAQGGAVKGGAAKDDDSEGGDEAILAALEDERTRRIVEEARILDRLDQETKLLRELYEKEREVRKEAGKALIMTIESFGKRVHSQLTEERKARKAVEETILRILDETAEKVGKSLYKVKEKR